MGRRGREIVLAHHDWDDLTARTEEVVALAAEHPEAKEADADALALGSFH